MSVNSFNARSQLQVGQKKYEIYRLSALAGVERLPYSLKILLENLLRNEDGANIRAEHIKALAERNLRKGENQEIQFTPARVIMQDFTGVPCVVDLAAMREAVAELGGNPDAINPLRPAEMVIDHSVQIDVFGSKDALKRNMDREYERNGERYQFLRWGQNVFRNFKVVPPGMGIVHQVNLEYLARVVMQQEKDGVVQAYPDTCVGTDSHTTMVNGLGVLGWGVGGIEAEAAMLGQPVSMLIPPVVGFRLRGEIPAGATATDVVLTITEMLRAKGVVGKIVEFYGEGLSQVPLANRATIGNMSPEFGSTAAIFPIDEATLDYLRLTGRSAEQIALVEAYAKEQGLWANPQVELEYSEYMELDLSTVVPSISGPKRPQDRIALAQAQQAFLETLPNYLNSDTAQNPVPVPGIDGSDTSLSNGDVVIASITSCTNTSNPSVMLAAALLARNAVAKGLRSKPWVKTSLAPGSKVVSDYYEKAGLWPALEALGFNLVGYGCATCIGNSGPLPQAISDAVNKEDLVVLSVLSGNRNFEGRINPDVKMNYLASPPLVIAYALAGSMNFDFATMPLGQDEDGADVYLRDIWPDPAEVAAVMAATIDTEMYRRNYRDIFAGDERWQNLSTPAGELFAWDADSTYIRKPPYFVGMKKEIQPVADIVGARVLAKLGDSVTTDHISPAGAIKANSPAGRYLEEQGVARVDFNSYGSRRGNHEVMIRGTFANIRLRNQLLDGVEGGYTWNFLSDKEEAIFDAAQAYKEAKVPLVVLGGKEYGSGSSRDWAAKGTALLGVKAVLAESFERIHRSNLIGMGVLPLQYQEGENAASLGLDGREVFTISGISALNSGITPETLSVTAEKSNGEKITFAVRLRIDTPGEADYFRHGGILQYVLRQLVG